MVILDQSVMTILHITRIPFLDDEQWHSILSSLQLPRLDDLMVANDVHISLTTLISFVNRHSTIKRLALCHHSISYPSNPDMKPSVSPNFVNLERLQASGRFICLILRSHLEPLPNLRYIHIGPLLQYNSYSRPAEREKVETPFDFAALDGAFMAVGDSTCDIEMLGVTLPGGAVAMDWLASSMAAGTSKLHPKELSIATECGIPLHLSVILLLADWIIKTFPTTTLRKVAFAQWVIVGQSERAGFEKRIREVTDAVAVGFSAEIDCHAW
jgi:hypothetical protein